MPSHVKVVLKMNMQILKFTSKTCCCCTQVENCVTKVMANFQAINFV